MPTTYRIPKQTDREIIQGLQRIKCSWKEQSLTKLVFILHHGDAIELNQEAPEETPRAKYYLGLNGRVAQSIRLDLQAGNSVITVSRATDAVYDNAYVEDNWINTFNPNERSKAWASINALVARELRSDDLAATFSALHDNEWNIFRKAQIEVLNSLQQTNQTVLIEAAKSLEQYRKHEDEKSEQLRLKLTIDTDQEKARLQEDYKKRMDGLDRREEDLNKKFKEYETHEALYVARAKAEENLKQLKEWLRQPSLNEATVKKREPIQRMYALLIWVFGIPSIVAITESVYAFFSGNIPLTWWQWLFMSLRCFFPLAATATTIIYYIRWENEWAKQHAEEELQMRARVIDIGRSAWLLEAIHDEKNGIPEVLVKELAKNMFNNHHASSSSDVSPQAIPDLIWAGLQNIRIKTDVGEVEASREKQRNRKG